MAANLEHARDNSGFVWDATTTAPSVAEEKLQGRHTRLTRRYGRSYRRKIKRTPAPVTPLAEASPPRLLPEHRERLDSFIERTRSMIASITTDHLAEVSRLHAELAEARILGECSKVSAVASDARYGDELMRRIGLEHRNETLVAERDRARALALVERRRSTVLTRANALPWYAFGKRRRLLALAVELDPVTSDGRVLLPHQKNPLITVS